MCSGLWMCVCVKPSFPRTDFHKTWCEYFLALKSWLLAQSLSSVDSPRGGAGFELWLYQKIHFLCNFVLALTCIGLHLHLLCFLLASHVLMLLHVQELLSCPRCNRACLYHKNKNRRSRAVQHPSSHQSLRLTPPRQLLSHLIMLRGRHQSRAFEHAEIWLCQVGTSVGPHASPPDAEPSLHLPLLIRWLITSLISPQASAVSVEQLGSFLEHRSSGP